MTSGCLTASITRHTPRRTILSIPYDASLNVPIIELFHHPDRFRPVIHAITDRPECRTARKPGGIHGQMIETEPQTVTLPEATAHHPGLP